jgi:maleate cis-trans isomerase
VVTSTHAQTHALRALGARKVATVQPFVEETNADHEVAMRNLGVEPTGVIACGYTVEDLGRIPGELAITLAQQIKREHPEADTINRYISKQTFLDMIERI